MPAPVATFSRPTKLRLAPAPAEKALRLDHRMVQNASRHEGFGEPSEPVADPRWRPAVSEMGQSPASSG
jgi:hypothetical protein